jgi:hypothetical protein
MFKDHKLNFWFTHLSVKSRNRARGWYLKKRTTAWPISQSFNSLNFSNDSFYNPERFASLESNNFFKNGIDTKLYFSDSDSDKEEAAPEDELSFAINDLRTKYLRRVITKNQIKNRKLFVLNEMLRHEALESAYDITKNPYLISMFSFPKGFALNRAFNRHRTNLLKNFKIDKRVRRREKNRYMRMGRQFYR